MLPSALKQFTSLQHGKCRREISYFLTHNTIWKSSKHSAKPRNELALCRMVTSNADIDKNKFPNPLRGVLFDMDVSGSQFTRFLTEVVTRITQGTLSDSESLHWRAYQNVFLRELPQFQANPISRPYYNAHMGGRTKVTFERYSGFFFVDSSGQANALASLLPQTGPEQRARLAVLLEQVLYSLLLFLFKLF